MISKLGAMISKLGAMISELGAMISELRIAARSLARSPGFTIPAVLTLALGLAGSLTVTRLIDAVLLHPVPFAEAPDLVAIDGDSVSYPFFLDLERESAGLERVAAYRERSFALGGPDGATLVQGATVTGSYFETLRLPAALGRTLRPADETSGDPLVAVVSHGLFVRRLGGDPAALGRRLVVNGVPLTVAGVLPERFRGLRLTASPEIYVPIAAWRSLATGSFAGRDTMARGWGWLTVFGRLKEGVSEASSQAEIDAFVSRQRAAHPHDLPEKARFTATPLASAAAELGDRRDLNRFLGLLAVAVGLGLAIACSNVASLLLSRSLTRERDVAVRQALGASRMRLLAPLLLEGLLVSLLAAALAFVLSGAGAEALATGVLQAGLQLPGPEPAEAARAGVAALLLGLGVAVATTLAAARKTARADLVARLKGAAAAGRTGDARPALLALQLGVSVLLVGGAAVVLSSLAGALGSSPGYALDRLAYLSVHPRLARHDEATGALYRRNALERLRAIPGVAAASATLLAPMEPGQMEETIEVPGATSGHAVSFLAAGDGYFRTLGVPLVDGRDLSPEDRAGAPGAAVLNEAAARALWPGRRAVGQTFRLLDASWTVVGVARDWKQHTVRSAPDPIAVVSLEQIGKEALSSLTFVVRTTGDPTSILPALRAGIASLDRNVPAAPPVTAASTLADSLTPHRLAAALLAAFGLLAVGLVLMGAYGLTSLAVAERGREIGVRLALGATARDVARLMGKRVARPALAGIAAGLLLTLLLLRGAASMAPEARGARALAGPLGAAGLLAALTLAAAAVPVRRGTRIDPASILRAE